MEKFVTINSKAVPWLMPNVDTDIITPMKRMLSASDKLEKYAFEPYRFSDGNGDTGAPNPDFPLNDPKYHGARIMIVGENFGSGSSRETAPSAIYGLGLRVLIGSTFGGIFFKNCFKTGLLAVSLEESLVKRFALLAEEGHSFTVDLEEQRILVPGEEPVHFEIEAMRKTALLEGLDDIDMTLKHGEEIECWRQKDQMRRPWIYKG